MTSEDIDVVLDTGGGVSTVDKEARAEIAQLKQEVAELRAEIDDINRCLAELMNA